MRTSCTPNLMFPDFRERVDTGRPEFSFRSGCRGFIGLVPQPLCMKFRSAPKSKTCDAYAKCHAAGSQAVHSLTFCVNGRRICIKSSLSAVRRTALMFSGCQVSGGQLADAARQFDRAEFHCAVLEGDGTARDFRASTKRGFACVRLPPVYASPAVGAVSGGCCRITLCRDCPST